LVSFIIRKKNVVNDERAKEEEEEIGISVVVWCGKKV